MEKFQLCFSGVCQLFRCHEILCYKLKFAGFLNVIQQHSQLLMLYGVCGRWINEYGALVRCY